MNQHPTDVIVEVRTVAGKVTLLRVPLEHLQRVMDLANTHYGDTAKVIKDGPFIKQPEPQARGKRGR
jgi:hypothetical protein